MLALTAETRRWEPKRLRLRLFSAAAQLVTTGRRRWLPYRTPADQQLRPSRRTSNNPEPWNPGRGRLLVSRMESAIERLSLPGSSYTRQLDLHRERRTKHKIHDVYSIAVGLRDDLKAGWTESVMELVHADTYSDYLKMADDLLAAHYKDPAHPASCRTSPAAAPTAPRSETSRRWRRSPLGGPATGHPAAAPGPEATARSAPTARQSTTHPDQRADDPEEATTRRRCHRSCR